MNHLTGINIGISMDFSLVSVSVEYYLSVCASGSLVILGVPLCGFLSPLPPRPNAELWLFCFLMYLISIHLFYTRLTYHMTESVSRPMNRKLYSNQFSLLNI